MLCMQKPSPGKPGESSGLQWYAQDFRFWTKKAMGSNTSHTL